MRGKIQVRTRLTSGNIKDPELHQQKLANIEQNRKAFQTITLVLVGSIVFVVLAVVLSIAG